ncbi:MAG: transporter, partial [Acidobacteriota bacterium]
ERQELTIEAPIIFRNGPTGDAVGFGDVILGTKYRLLGEPAADSGLSVSLEVKLPTGNDTRGLGSGATDVDLLSRWGWQFGPEVDYLNLGHTWVGERRGERLDNAWFYSGVWDHPVSHKLRLLAEVYGETAAEPGNPNQLAATIGIKWWFHPTQQFHFSVGRSLREDTEGGPKLRLYTGWRRDF